MLNLEWFRTFKAVYQTGNLSTAAQSLFISQPGVSVHLNSLEAYTGYRLFERVAKKMVPTERGTILYNCIIDPINKLEVAEELFHRNSRIEKPTIGVGMGLEIFKYALEAHLAQLPFNLVLRFGEYRQILHELDTGKLDLILTPQRGQQTNLEYTPFTKERIVLICGSGTDTEQFDEMVLANDRPAIRHWLKAQVWYATAADMEHLQRFWMANFDCLPELKPNYIVPCFSSILRCLSNGKGFAVIPDFLAKKAIALNSVKLAWEGCPHVENTLHFGKRKKSVYSNEIRQLEEILTNNWLQ
jgi:LysR family transcriptional regulator, transcriptional activator of the cysJI operon